MNVAIVGAGAAGLLHAMSFRAAGCVVTQIYDPDREAARALTELCGGSVATDLSLVATGDAEIVSICSPPRVHVDQAEACARPGRTIFVEKPVATNHAELRRLARLGQCVPIVQWRSGRALRAVRNAIADGHLGPAPSAAIDLVLRRDEAYFARRTGANAWGCGVLLSVGIHALDALVFAFGRPVVSVARASTEGHLSDARLVGFAGGAFATVRVTFEAGGDDEARLAFCGRGVTGTIVGGEADPTASRVAWSARDPHVQARLATIESGAGGALHGPLLVPYIGDAINALRAGKRLGSCDALPSIEDVSEGHRIGFPSGVD